MAQAVDQVHSWLKKEISMDSDDVCEEEDIGQVNLECVRNKVKRTACPSNGDCSCGSGLVTPEMAELFDTHPDRNTLLYTKVGDMVVITIAKM